MDFLWIYTSIAGALLGAACLAYIRDTRIGLWGYSKFDQACDYLRDRYGWTWFDQDPEAWKKVNPKIAAKIQELENRINNLSKISGDNRNLSNRKNSTLSMQPKDYSDA